MPKAGNVVLKTRNGKTSVFVGHQAMLGVLAVETSDDRAGNSTVIVRLHGRFVNRETVKSDEELAFVG